MNCYDLRVYMVHIPQRISAQDFFPAAGVDTALTQQNESGTKPQRKVQIVDNNNRCQMLFMANIPNDLQNLILILNIQAARRLIEQQELRLLRQRTRQHHLLPFTAR